MRGLLSRSWRPARTGTQKQSLSLCRTLRGAHAHTQPHTNTHTHSGAVGKAVSHLSPSGEKQQQACHSPGLCSAWLRSVEGQTAGPGLLALPRIMGPARTELGSTSPPPCEEILPGTLRHVSSRWDNGNPLQYSCLENSTD